MLRPESGSRSSAACASCWPCAGAGDDPRMLVDFSIREVGGAVVTVSRRDDWTNGRAGSGGQQHAVACVRGDSAGAVSMISPKMSSGAMAGLAHVSSGGTE